MWSEFESAPNAVEENAMSSPKLVAMSKMSPGLATRSDFERNIGGAEQVVMIISPTGIGAINRMQGFNAGDLALAEFGRALRQSMPEGAVQCHVGGSKFAAAVPAENEFDAMEAMGALFDDLSRLAPDLCPPHIGGAWSSTAVGADAIFSAALSALDIAEHDGPHGVELKLIDPAEDMSDLALAREALDAIRAGSIRAAFQPVVDAETPGRVLFQEALIRLQRKNGDTISAARFMPTLARLGLAAEADIAMLRFAFDALIENPSLRISVNLSAQSFGRPQWRDEFNVAADRAPELAERLIVEVSEDVATSDLNSVGDLLGMLRSRGATIALDDFGAGRTSFSHLRDFRFDIVKIDGGFIRSIDQSPDNQVLVSALTSIGRAFDMMVVAEFVETAQEARILRKLGVDGFQGYLFGSPTLVWSEGSRVHEAPA